MSGRALDLKLQEAASHMKAGAFGSALQIYFSVIAEHKENRPALKGVESLMQTAAGARTPESIAVCMRILEYYWQKKLFKNLIEASELFLEQYPKNAQILNILGGALLVEDRLSQAYELFLRVIELSPTYVPALSNLSFLARQMGRLDEAEKFGLQALSFGPDDVIALINLAAVYAGQGRPTEAISAYDRALEQAPLHPVAFPQKLDQQAKVCDWKGDAEFQEHAGQIGLLGHASPFVSLIHEDNPSRQLQRSRAWVARQSKESATWTPRKTQSNSSKIRIGYFSADCHDHPVMHLLMGVLAHRDRSRFSIDVFSFGPNKVDEKRQELVREADAFHEVSTASDRHIIELARKANLNIAIDLTGHTKNGRLGIFLARVAPVQINFLGYPGSSGASFMDYIVTDPVVVPPETRANYTEALFCMPHTYQPNDDRRELSGIVTTRKEFGLPEHAFVLCCFNAPSKIRPREFNIWMRIMRQCPNTVLWLLRSNNWVEKNLRAEAEARNIQGDRLIFADRCELSMHLERHRHADLFVDTFHYNAHTTANDALWAGLPIVTKKGKQFAARVAAGLLYAAGCPELVTDSEDAYESLILNLVSNETLLASLRERLRRQKREKSLFNTAAYTRAFERGLVHVHERASRGEPPCDFKLDSECE